MSKNERKTEDIVRNHFKKYLSDIVLEEQISDNPKIKKLLSTASKNGLGRGCPEFIIQYKNNPDFLIMIECKADVSKHESKTHQQYKDYSVDGALLYSSYLSKDFDVLSVAVSGEGEKELKVSHFMQLRGEKKAATVFSNKLLSPEDYMQGYLKSPEKFRQDYDKLISFSRDLNDALHTLQIKEDLRALLISAILIALEDNAFKKAYKDYTDAKQLARFLVNTTLNQFEKAKLQNTKIEDLKVIYQQITIVDGLVNDIKNIKDLITSIDENINDFIRTHEYFDVLGQLYIEFLRYANSDKGLGIVLTPPHITEFMAELGEVNKNSVVYDSCAGTGGFLVSAMKLMIDDAKGDLEKIKEIKAKQLIGVENKSHIFALACSNMFIHQDGKTNILNGSCFDEEVISLVKQKNPTVGLLNPPYKSDKKKDIEELDFILNNIECLEQGGKCIAIVPMQTALAQKGKVLELKNKLLEQHTLEAVLSMPDELFFNSKVGVVSCIMVFTAKRPHPKNKKTFFGYFKNDGFVKRKNKGRIDVYGKWDTVKEKWINAYINKEDIAGISVNKVVGAKDEWCAEAYMETDYSGLLKDDFQDAIITYTAFLLSSKMIKDAIFKPLIEKEFLLDNNKLISYKLDDLFEITGSKTTSILELEEYGFGKYPFVTTQATNNGVEGFYDFYTENGNVLVVDSAVLGYCSYQPYNFSASDHVEKLIPKFEMNKYIAMFLSTIINKERYRYNYGRKCSQDRMKQKSIKLPAKNDKPDWQFMEDYIKSLPYSSSLK